MGPAGSQGGGWGGVNPSLLLKGRVATMAAPLLLDLVWPVLVLAGVEAVEIDPGNTALTPLAFTYYPFTHSLVCACIGGGILGCHAVSNGGNCGWRCRAQPLVHGRHCPPAGLAALSRLRDLCRARVVELRRWDRRFGGDSVRAGSLVLPDFDSRHGSRWKIRVLVSRTVCHCDLRCEREWRIRPAEFKGRSDRRARAVAIRPVGGVV